MSRNFYLLIFSWLLIFSVLTSIILWIFVAINTPDGIDPRPEYFSYFPRFINNGQRISLASIVILFISLGTLAYLINKSYKKGIAILGFVVAIILLGINLWSVM